MTTTMNHPERVKLQQCPPWCAGHNELYQAWEDYGSTQQRSHSSEDVRLARSVAVGVVRLEDWSGRMGDPTIELYLANDREDLTPAEARRVAAALLEAVERVEAIANI